MDHTNIYVTCQACGETYNLAEEVFGEERVIAGVCLLNDPDYPEIDIIAMCKHNYDKISDHIAERPLNVEFIGYATSFVCLQKLVSQFSRPGMLIYDENDLLLGPKDSDECITTNKGETKCN